MAKKLFQLDVKVPDPPKAIYMIRRKNQTQGPGTFQDLSKKVVVLVIETAFRKDDSEQDRHAIRRLDAHGKTVWKTIHPSLQETFWHAEWEYEVKAEAWKQIKDP